MIATLIDKIYELYKDDQRIVEFAVEFDLPHMVRGDLKEYDDNLKIILYWQGDEAPKNIPNKMDSTPVELKHVKDLWQDIQFMDRQQLKDEILKLRSQLKRYENNDHWSQTKQIEQRIQPEWPALCLAED